MGLARIINESSYPIRDIVANRDKDWHGCLVCRNPGITVAEIATEIAAHPDFSERDNWYDVSRNPNVTMHDILKYKDKKWDWSVLSCHPNITLQHILAHPERIRLRSLLLLSLRRTLLLILRRKLLIIYTTTHSYATKMVSLTLYNFTHHTYHHSFTFFIYIIIPQIETIKIQNIFYLFFIHENINYKN